MEERDQPNQLFSLLNRSPSIFLQLWLQIAASLFDTQLVPGSDVHDPSPDFFLIQGFLTHDLLELKLGNGLGNFQSSTNYIYWTYHYLESLLSSWLWISKICMSRTVLSLTRSLIAAAWASLSEQRTGALSGLPCAESSTSRNISEHNEMEICIYYNKRQIKVF